MKGKLPSYQLIISINTGKKKAFKMNPELGNSIEILYLHPKAGKERKAFYLYFFKYRRFFFPKPLQGPIAQSVRATDS